VLLISGCAGRPLLTKDNSYSIITVAPDGEAQSIPIKLSWNSNFAVMQKLLLEASFVLSDLHTKPASVPTDLVEDSESMNSGNTSGTNDTLEDPKVGLLESNDPNSNKEWAKNRSEPAPDNSAGTVSSDSESRIEGDFLKEFLFDEGHEDREIPDFFTTHQQDTILLVANFPEAKQFMLMIDNEEYLTDITSIQVEIQGKNPGRVVINQYINLQGIVNPNLISAFEELIEMLENTKEKYADRSDFSFDYPNEFYFLGKV
jgi:hypothetical protein